MINILLLISATSWFWSHGHLQEVQYVLGFLKAQMDPEDPAK